MRFRVFGVPVDVQGSFWLGTVLISFGLLQQPLRMAEWIAVVFVSILVHELGHATAASTFGGTPRISLHAMGGTTAYLPAFPGWRRAVIAVSGPLAGFVVGAAVLASNRAFPGGGGDVEWIRRQLTWV